MTDIMTEALRAIKSEVAVEKEWPTSEWSMGPLPCGKSCKIYHAWAYTDEYFVQLSPKVKHGPFKQILFDRPCMEMAPQ